MNLKQLERRGKAKAAVAYARGQIDREEYGEVLVGVLSVQGGYLVGPHWDAPAFNIIRKLGSNK